MPRISFNDSAFVLFYRNQEQSILEGIEPPYLKVWDHVSLRESRNEGALGTIIKFNQDTVALQCPTSKASDEGYSVSLLEEPNPGFVKLEVAVQDLRLSPGYSLEVLAKLVYRHLYHTVYLPPREVFTKEFCPTCWHEKCEAKSIGAGIINFWGSVYPVVMCEEHSLIHGHLTEYDPFSNRPESWRQTLRAHAAKEKTT